MIKFEAVNSRIIKVEMEMDSKLNIIQMHAPYEERIEKRGTKLYIELQLTLDKMREKMIE